MYFKASKIAQAIVSLAIVHPFHGITFLACKRARLPIGKGVNFALDAKTEAFLQKHHRIDPASTWFFQPFKSSDARKKWVRPDYSAKGLQAINTQTFLTAFIHTRNAPVWGWQKSYVNVLSDRLPRKKKIQKKIPAFDLAVWLYRDEEWPDGTTPSKVVKRFVDDYYLTKEERDELFDMAPPNVSAETVFQPARATWAELRLFLPAAPDSKPDQGGTLTYLRMRSLGPAASLELEPAKRLTLITGDNGLGKTFLLECAWWALTGIWAERPAYPNTAADSKKAEITFAIEGEQSKGEKTTIAFDALTQSWPQPKKRPTIPGLIVYARVDGSFAVWDPARQAKIDPSASQQRQAVFSSLDVWDGLPGRIEGLVRDWVRWQNSSTKSPFETFVRVLAHLSPPDLGTLEPGPPVRIPGDPRDIPTIKHPFGTIPILYTSAGVRRIVTLAYLIVWAWNEHVIAADQSHTPAQRRMVVLVDEIEAHLHPRWQRSVLPALLSVGEMLNSDLQVQYIAATHSPLVMASAEPVFNSEIDSLVHLDLAGDGKVTLEEIDFVKFGDISAWLTSPVFELRHARSNEAEGAIEAAKELQLRKRPSSDEIRDVTARLVRYLSPEDKFWPRWISFAEKYGVQL